MQKVPEIDSFRVSAVLHCDLSVRETQIDRDNSERDWQHVKMSEDFTVLRDLQSHLRTAQVPFEQLSTLAQQGDDMVRSNT